MHRLGNRTPFTRYSTAHYSAIVHPTEKIKLNIFPVGFKVWLDMVSTTKYIIRLEPSIIVMRADNLTFITFL